MPSPDEYRRKAAEMTERTKQESDPFIRAEYVNLARGYLRLAEQAEQNALTDLVYAPSLDRPPAQQPQQQQQPQRPNGQPEEQ